MNSKNSKNLPLYRSMAKYGLNSFEFSVLESGLTQKQAAEREIYYIIKYDSQNRDFGYNIRGGGELPYHTEESIKKQQDSAYAFSRNGREYKGVVRQRPDSTHGVKISIYGAILHIQGYRTEIEAAWEHDLLTLKHKTPGAYLNFPQGKTKEIILEQLISRKALMNRYLIYNMKYNQTKKRWIVRGKDVFTGIVSEIAKAKTYEECELLLENYKRIYKPLGEHKHCSLIAKRSYEKLYGPIKDTITEAELEIAYKDIGTFSNEHVDSLFKELIGKDWK